MTDFNTQCCALVDPATGEVKSFVYPGNSNDYIEGAITNGLQIKWGDEFPGIDPAVLNNSCQSHYFDYSDNTFKVKPTSPGNFYDWSWETKSWTNNLTRIFQWIRRDRDYKLSQCDWTQYADSPLTDEKKAEWVTYRTALRDFPANNSTCSDYEALTWPTEPS